MHHQDFQFTFDLISYNQNEDQHEDDDSDFSIEDFDTTLKNLLQLYESKASLESFQENLKKMKGLVSKFHQKISVLLRSRDLIQFFLALLYDEIKEIQIYSLIILKHLVKEDETTIKFLVDLNAYQVFFDMLSSQDLDYIRPICKLFCYSNFTSLLNFVHEIFLPNFLDAFLNIFNQTEDVYIKFSISEVLYSLFDIDANVDYEILKRIYQEILGDLFRADYYQPFLQFAQKILDKRRLKTDNYDEFLSDFYQTDFPKMVIDLFHSYFDEEYQVSSKDLLKCIDVLKLLIKRRPAFLQEKGILNENHDSPFLREMRHLIFWDDPSINPQIKEKSSPDINDISVLAIKFFKIIIKHLGPEAVTEVSNLGIISTFIDNITDFSYKLKSPLLALCLTAYGYSNDEQFIALAQFESNEQTYIQILIENIDQNNPEHLKGLNEMISNASNVAQQIDEEEEFLLDIFLPSYDTLSSINSDNLIYEKNFATNLSMLLGKLDKALSDEVPKNDEGLPPDDEFDYPS